MSLRQGHSEPVTDVTGVGIPIFQGIATPVCALVRNDLFLI